MNLKIYATRWIIGSIYSRVTRQRATRGGFYFYNAATPACQQNFLIPLRLSNFYKQKHRFYRPEILN